jgi:Glycosyltransferase family 87
VRAVLDRYVAAFRVIRDPVFLGALPVVILTWALVLMVTGDDVAVDFHHELYPQAELLLDWENPYPAPDADLSDGRNPIWPVAATALVAPLALLPAGVADGLMTALVIASFAGALLVMGVRDWRVFGAVALWPATLNAIQTGNLTLPLCLLAALVWRFRDRRWISGVALGAALALKFFLWPLAVWLISIRRWQSAAIALAIAAASLLLVLPFTGIDEYVRLLRNLGETFDEHSYTVYGFLVDAGAPDTIARGAYLAVGITVLAFAWRRRSFALAVAAALALSPIVWLHFFALLALPLAVTMPRFRWPWLLPLAMYPAPGTLNGGAWQSFLVLATAAAVIGLAERPPERREPSRIAASAGAAP